MTHCVGHSQCPECAKLGKDRDANNLANYSDGSSYCFSCSYYISANGIKAIKESKTKATRSIGLPRDVDQKLPRKAWDFLRQYELDEHDIKINTILWSEHWQRLCFPVFDTTGLLAWQGRYLGDDKTKPKWFSQGDLKNIIHIVGNKQSNVCVLTEDLISAIKVGKTHLVSASPIFGSHVSTQRILHLQLLYDTLYVWLDKDKQKESIKFSNNAGMLGLNSRSVITDLDPKCYSIEQIKRLLTMHE